MKHLKIWMILTLLLSFSGKLSAQIDSIFYFAAPWVTPDHDNNVQMAMRFSSFNNPTTVRVQQPLQTLDTTFIIPPNSLFSLSLDSLVNEVESKPADTDIGTGFEITSDELITVVYDFISDTVSISPGSPNNPETYSLKGQNGLGKEFVVPFQTLWDNRQLNNDRNNDGDVTQPKQYFSVVATEDNTTIYITPRCNVIGGHPANVTYSVVLPFKGSVYTCENAVLTTSSVPGSSLAGTVVVSDKDVAITMNDDSVNPAGGGGCFDLMGDQIVPVDVIGTDYIVNKGFLNAGSDESLFLVATENFTTFTIQDGVNIETASINQGDTYQFSITEQLTFATADKPVYLLHMSGYGCELGEAILPPLNCSGSDQVTFTRNNDQQFLLNILTPTGSEGDFTLNGSTTLVESTDFSPVPGTGGAWMGAQIDFPETDIPSNSSNLIENSSEFFSLGVINGGPGTGCLYHYMSSFVRKVIVETMNDTTYCSGVDTVGLSGTVKGGAVTGIWTTINGGGTIENPTNLTTEYMQVPADYALGTVSFVLTSTGNCLPTSDTLRIDFVQSPEVEAGTGTTQCDNNLSPVNIIGNVLFAAAGNWSGGAGSFANSGSSNTMYTPTQTEVDNGSVMLYYSSVGSFTSCPDVSDSVEILFVDAPFVSAGPDLSICSSQDSVQLNGVVSGYTTEGIWSTTDGTGAFGPSELDLNSSYFFSQVDTTLNEITLVLTSTNNGICLEEQDSITIQIVDRPNVHISAADSVCSDITTINLAGSVTSGFGSLWTSSGNGTINNPTATSTDYNVSIIDTVNGFIDVILSSTGFCPSETDSIRIHFVDAPRAEAGADIQLCENENIQLNAQVTGEYSSLLWTTTGSGTFISNTQANTVYQPSSLDVAQAGVDLVITVQNSFGCPPHRDTMEIDFLPSPSASFDFTNVCQNTLLPFSDNSTFPEGTISNWEWQFGDNTTSSVQNPSHLYSIAGIFEPMLIVTGSNGCSDSLAQTVEIYPEPQPFFNFTNPCEGQEFNVTDASFISTGNIVSWSYDFAGQETINEQNTSYTFIVPGQIPITLTTVSAAGCSADTTLLVDVFDSPDVDFNINPNPALLEQQITFDDASTGSGLDSWIWNFGDGEVAAGENTTHSYSEYGNFPVTLSVSDTNGCTGISEKTLVIALKPVLPSGFSPNGDSENDIFIIRGGPFASVQFNVYDNWGELVFSTTDANEGWDGTYKGAPAALGVYTWTFVVEMLNGQIIKESGDVTLIR